MEVCDLGWVYIYIYTCMHFCHFLVWYMYWEIQKMWQGFFFFLFLSFSFIYILIPISCLHILEQIFILWQLKIIIYKLILHDPSYIQFVKNLSLKSTHSLDLVLKTLFLGSKSLGQRAQIMARHQPLEALKLTRFFTNDFTLGLARFCKVPSLIR